MGLGDLMVSKLPPRRVHEIVPVTSTGSERVQYALVGRGSGADMGHGHLRFESREAAMQHMETHQLQHYTEDINSPEKVAARKVMFKSFGWGAD
jgi:hypothetical protein